MAVRTVKAFTCNMFLMHAGEAQAILRSMTLGADAGFPAFQPISEIVHQIHTQRTAIQTGVAGSALQCGCVIFYTMIDRLEGMHLGDAIVITPTACINQSALYRGIEAAGAEELIG